LPRVLVIGSYGVHLLPYPPRVIDTPPAFWHWQQ
jgi:hypothetical protein